MQRVFFLLAVFSLFQWSDLAAQKYVTALGLRVGTDWGITLQQRVAKRTTVEALAQSSFQRDEILVSAMLQQHFPFPGRRLNVYLGAGVHKGWLGRSRASAPLPDPEFAPASDPRLAPASDPELAPLSGSGYQDPLGVSVVGGLELSLGRLNVSYDVKPAINLQGGTRNFYTQSGLSLRYVLISDKDLKKRQRTRQRRKQKKQRARARQERREAGGTLWERMFG